MALIGLIEIIFGTVVPRTFNYYTVYMVGLLLGRNYYEQTMKLLRSKKTLLISLVWMILVVVVFLTKNNYLRSVSIIIGIIALLNISLLTAEKLRTGRLFTGSVTALSYASFCAYLFHREVIWVMFHVFKPQGSMPIFLYVLIVGVPLSFFCAYWIQKGYDKLLEKMTSRPDGHMATAPKDNLQSK